MRKHNYAKEDGNGALAYKVKLFNDFIKPYAYNEDASNMVRHKTYEEYVVYNVKTFRDVLSQFLDPPKKKLTTKDIHEDFDSPGRKISDANANCIKRYYNGRYSLMKHIDSELSKVDFSKIERKFPLVMKFNIPLELNFLSMEDDGKYADHVAMNDAFIEIEVSRIGG